MAIYLVVPTSAPLILGQVYLNGQRLPVKNFTDYVDMYLGPKENGVPRIYERFSDRWEVCVSTTEGQFQQVSYGQECSLHLVSVRVLQVKA
jgi:hypothetical protein